MTFDKGRSLRPFFLQDMIHEIRALIPVLANVSLQPLPIVASDRYNFVSILVLENVSLQPPLYI